MKLVKYLSVLVLLNAWTFHVAAQDAEPPASAETTEKPGEAGAAKVTTSLLPHVETLASETNQVSYAIGINTARNLKYNYPDVNMDFFILALRDAFAGEPKMSEEMINASIAKYSTEANRVARERG